MFITASSRYRIAPKDQKTYETGDYFGDVAFLRNERRHAAVVAAVDTKGVALSEMFFQLMPQSIQEAMKIKIYSAEFTMQ